ncbi:unnamed protein product [Dimorphilus gyrociliatus]|uniref:C2H2-type domain-containing protein n=1 Tax=Dimorphilus gyrociliatus TaxID=2664684 RepID=A0A7I8VWI1_9ANNE|nr:unnamed protein product [Dimorphilus gyrociliatus]
MTDFDACRFDFRLVAGGELQPSKRKKASRPKCDEDILLEHWNYNEEKRQSPITDEVETKKRKLDSIASRLWKSKLKKKKKKKEEEEVDGEFKPISNGKMTDGFMFHMKMPSKQRKLTRNDSKKEGDEDDLKIYMLSPENFESSSESELMDLPTQVPLSYRFDADTREEGAEEMEEDSDDIDDDDKYVCSICGSVQPSEWRLLLHTRAHQGLHSKLAKLSERRSKGQVRRRPPERNVTKCDYEGCNLKFENTRQLKLHQWWHMGYKPLACSLCDYVCSQRNSMNWHMKNKHGLDKVLTAHKRTAYVGADGVLVSAKTTFAPPAVESVLDLRTRKEES